MKHHEIIWERSYMLKSIRYEDITTKEKVIVDRLFWREHPQFLTRMRKDNIFPNVLDEIQLISFSLQETIYVDLVFDRQLIRFTVFQQEQYQYQFLIRNQKELLYVDTTPDGINMFNVLLYTIDSEANRFELALAMGAEITSIYLQMCHWVARYSIQPELPNEISVAETLITQL